MYYIHWYVNIPKLLRCFIFIISSAARVVFVIHPVPPSIYLLALLQARQHFSPTHNTRITTLTSALTEKCSDVLDNSLGKWIVSCGQVVEVANFTPPHVLPSSQARTHQHEVVDKKVACKKHESKYHQQHGQVARIKLRRSGMWVILEERMQLVEGV